MTGSSWRTLVAVVSVTLMFGAGSALADLTENPNLAMEGVGLDIAMAGVGLSDLEISGTETLSIDIGGPVQTAVLYWYGGGSAGEDDALLVNGVLVTAQVTDVNTDPAPFDIVGYQADVTALVLADCVTPGVCDLDIEDADLGNNFSSNLVGAGLLVIYTDPLDPNTNRIIVFDGIDWAFSRQGFPVAGPVAFTYPADPANRTGDLKLFTGDGEPDRTDRIDISDNPSILNEIVGNQGPQYDLFERSILIPAGVTQTTVSVVSPPEPPTADSLVLQTAALRLSTEPPPGGCISRTPGFWCTHDRVTELFLPVESCGLTVDNVDVATPTSSTEDLARGNDFKAAGTSPQQLQLIRQCTAAQLNIAATLAAGGNCEGDYPGIDALLAECCDDLCTSGASGPTISWSMCIERLDDFNNSEDALTCDSDPAAPFPFCPSLGANGFNATPEACQDSNGNGYVNPGRNLGPRR